MARLAHISDLHILDLTGVSAWQFVGKRVTGLVNLWGPRRNAHPVARAEALVATLAGMLADGQIDHVLCTGDLTNLSLEAEFKKAREVLEPIAQWENLSIIPGNHDVYTRDAERDARFERWFGDLMWKDEAPSYPWRKSVKGIDVFGLCSVLPTPPLWAHGRLDEEQLLRLEHAIDRSEAPFKIGMMHHNLHPRGRRKDAMHGLQDREKTLDRLASSGLNLLLHGHTHRAHRFVHEPLTIIGSGSSTTDTEDTDRTSRFNVYTIDGDQLTDTTVHAWDSSRGVFHPTT
jgi:3',5'-cyclic AMP phosphodiesterase CpdA